jgi:hypothetical protein
VDTFKVSWPPEQFYFWRIFQKVSTSLPKSVFLCFMHALILVLIYVLFSFKVDNFLNLDCVKIEIFTVCYNLGSKRICQSTGKQATYTDLSISCTRVCLECWMSSYPVSPNECFIHTWNSLKYCFLKNDKQKCFHTYHYSQVF